MLAQYTQGTLTSAHLGLQNALTLDQGDADAHILLGRLDFLERRPDKAHSPGN